MNKRYTAEERAEHRRKWVAALRSGAYRQGKGALRTQGDRYCCLGVACELAAAEGVVADPSLSSEPLIAGDVRAYSYDGSAAFLPDAVRNWLGLATVQGALKVGSTQYLTNLATANDSGNYGFEDLAALIESGALVLDEAEE